MFEPEILSKLPIQAQEVLKFWSETQKK